MSSTNITAAIGQMQRAEDAADTVPDGDSLNAGLDPEASVGADGPIGDDRVIEVKAPQEVIDQALAREETIAQECQSITASIRQLTYLRSDLHQARGMTQSLATEAINVIPGFGKGRPVNHYSNLPTATHYKASLEEIDLSIKANIVRYLEQVQEAISQTLDNLSYVADKSLDDWNAKCNASLSFGHHFGILLNLMKGAGLQYDQSFLIAQSLEGTSPGQHGELANNNDIDALINQSSYYRTMQQASFIGELGRQVIDAWNADLDAMTQPTGASVRQLARVPNAPTKVTLYGNKVIKLTDVEEYLRGLRASSKDPLEEPAFYDLLGAFNGAQGEAELPALISELKQCHRAFKDLLDHVRALSANVANYQINENAERYLPAVQAAAEELLAFVQAYGRHGLNQLVDYIATWASCQQHLIAFGCRLVCALDAAVTKAAPAALMTGENLRNEWREEVALVKQAAAVINPNNEG